MKKASKTLLMAIIAFGLIFGGFALAPDNAYAKVSKPKNLTITDKKIKKNWVSFDAKWSKVKSATTYEVRWKKTKNSDWKQWKQADTSIDDTGFRKTKKSHGTVTLQVRAKKGKSESSWATKSFKY